MLRSPFVIYADIECFLDTSTKQHIPSGVGYYIVSDHPSYQRQKVKIFKGEDYINQFLSSLLRDEKEMEGLISQITPMTLSSKEELEFKKSTECHICKNVSLKRKIK